MISSIQHTPQYKNKEFLYQKYVVERLSTTEIAQSIFSARSSVAKHLKLFGIPVRESGNIKKRPGYGLAYGKRIINRQEILHKREQDNIKKMVELHGQGFSYWKIADIFNSMKIPTQTGKGSWYAKTIHQILHPKKIKNLNYSSPLCRWIGAIFLFKNFLRISQKLGLSNCNRDRALSKIIKFYCKS